MNEVYKQLDHIPPEVRAIVEGDEIGEVIDQICIQFQIPEAWGGELLRATIRILTGLMKPSDFVPFIIDEYWVEEKEALAIAQAVNTRIFSLVKPQLALIHKIADEKLAHRIKVPKKPREEAVIPVMMPAPAAQSASQTPLPVPSPLSPVPTPPPQPIQSKPLSALAEKLGGQTKDPYREF